MARAAINVNNNIVTLSAHKLVPPGPHGTITLKNDRGEEIPQFDLLTRMHKEYGDVFGCESLFGTLHVLNHPDLVKAVFQNFDIVRNQLLSMALGEGVLAADNAHWQKQRRLMLPSFQRSRVSKLTQLMVAIAQEHVAQWNAAAQTKESLDLMRIMSHLTLSMVSRSMFSVDMDQHSKSFYGAYMTTLKYLGDLANATTFDTPMMISPRTNLDFQQALEQMSEAVYAIIRARRASAARPEDLLTLLLEAIDASSGTALTDLQIRDEVVTMLLAGHERLRSP